MFEHSLGVAAVDLLQRWRSHATATSAANNTLFAVFGVASPFGRFADSSNYRNPPYSMWLDDIAYKHGVEVPRRGGPDDDPTQPSTAAAAMLENGLSRRNSRRVAMTPAAHGALLDYHREKIALLEELKTLVPGSQRSKASFHVRACRTLIERLGKEPM
jgi:hypothetical protein